MLFDKSRGQPRTALTSAQLARRDATRRRERAYTKHTHHVPHSRCKTIASWRHEQIKARERANCLSSAYRARTRTSLRQPSTHPLSSGAVPRDSDMVPHAVRAASSKTRVCPHSGRRRMRAALLKLPAHGDHLLRPRRWVALRPRRCRRGPACCRIALRPRPCRRGPACCRIALRPRRCRRVPSC